MILLQMFFVFEGLWRNFFSVLEAWIRKVSPICGLLRFFGPLSLIPVNFRITADNLDDSALSVLRFRGWSSWRLWGLILAELLYFWTPSPLLALLQLQPFLSLPRNALGRLLFIGVWGWVSDTWRSLTGDTCHSLIGPLMSSLTRARLLVSSLTRALMRDWFLHDTWQISIGFWVVIAKPSSNMWCFVICCILWTW